MGAFGASRPGSNPGSPAHAPSARSGNIRSPMRAVTFSEEEAREAVQAARSCSEALRRLGYRVAGGNHATLKKYAQACGISTDHFDTSWANRIPRRRGRIPMSAILVEQSTYSRAHLKDRLFEEGFRQRA